MPAFAGMTENDIIILGNKNFYVYIITNKRNGTLYTGMTNDLLLRVYIHKHKFNMGFSHIYDLDRLVYFESSDDVYSTLKREKQLKKWNRDWKLRLIEKSNPSWKDLFYEIGGKEFSDSADYNLLREIYSKKLNK